MISFLFIALAFLVLIALLSVLAHRLGVASSIAMLVCGIAISYVPGLPAVALDPDLVLLLFLPPLLYAAGVGMSWRGFCGNLRLILLLAVGCVIFTAAAVAAVCHLVFGIPWAVGFVLGAIVAPPDAVAPMAIAKRLGLPRRLATVLEGESLVNDATALVLFGFAIGWVVTGTFSPGEAALRFVVIVIAEIAWGIAVGAAALRLRHWSRNPQAEILLALATPFAAFWLPHETGGSGVVAAVAAGLYVSWNGPRLIRPATRLQGFFVWGLLTWTIEALVFLLTGLQAKAVVAGLDGERLMELLVAGAAVSLTVVMVRFVWVFPAVYLPRLLWRPLRERDPYPPWQLPFFLALAGLRGVVSLAAALSVPVMVDGAPFPERDLILFVTFCVIAATIVGLGSVLPLAVRWLGVGEAGRLEAATDKRAEQQVRLAGIDAALARLDEMEAAGAPPSGIAALRRRHGDRRTHLAVTADPATPDDPVIEATLLQLELIAAERAALARAWDQDQITDEARRRIERELDLEWSRARHAAASESAQGSDGGDPADRSNLPSLVPPPTGATDE